MTDREFACFMAPNGPEVKPWLGVIVLSDTDPAQVVDILLAETQENLSAAFAEWLKEPHLPSTALS